ncbi:MAG: LysM peptidoglycan-binding domain-containing protein, partial [Proteobacteria bacterium]|nr:LysM peptidoglycan-binding domain-containing protein [Pseudomonadota bacterium]
MQIRRTYGLLATALLAAACTPTLVNFAPRVHVVQPGDTLFSIAWRHQLDVRQLVLWNEIENPDLILVGQQLFLTPPGSAGARTAIAGGTPAAPPASPGTTGS